MSQLTLLYATIKKYCLEHQLIKPDMKIIIGLSGGPDSVFLLHFLIHLQKEFNLSLIAAHLNHEWRTTAADDAAFCQQLTGALSIPYIIKKASQLAYTPDYNGSQEEAGRKLRQFFFTELAHEFNADAIALGHHADDQQETFFMRIIRGTTLSGLACMKPHNALYIRPLLLISKEIICKELALNKISYCTDETNNSQSHLRNRIRTHLIPAAHQCDKRFHKQFERTLHHIQKAEAFLDILTQETFNRYALTKNSLNGLDKKGLLSLNPFLRDRVIVYWLIHNKIIFPLSESFIDEINRFLMRKGKKSHQITQYVTLHRTDEYISIEKKSPI